MSSLCLMYVFLPRSTAKSPYLWSSPVLSGCSSRHPWCKPQLPVFPPQGSFTGRSSGGHLAIFLLWCPLSITSYRGSLALGGAGTPVPCMMVAHTQGNANLWCDEKKPVLVEDLWPSLLVHHFIGGYISHDLLYHLPSLFFPPILDLPLSFPGIYLHYYQVTRFQVHCAYFSVVVPFLSACFCGQLGLCLPQGAPQSISHRSYIHVHTPGRGLSHWGLIAAKGGEDKVDWSLGHHPNNK